MDFALTDAGSLHSKVQREMLVNSAVPVTGKQMDPSDMLKVKNLKPWQPHTDTRRYCPDC